jgi:hypothetical protein
MKHTAIPRRQFLTAGAAGLGAARAGARVRLFEAQGSLGGVWTSSLLGYLLDFDKPGFNVELVRRLRERGAINGDGANSMAAALLAGRTLAIQRWRLICCPLFTARLLAGELLVYPPGPGLAASGHYHVRVRPVGGECHGAFAWETACKTSDKRTDAYFDTLARWTHAHVNSEPDGAVEVGIACVNGQPICSSAEPDPTFRIHAAFSQKTGNAFPWACDACCERGEQAASNRIPDRPPWYQP